MTDSAALQKMKDSLAEAKKEIEKLEKKAQNKVQKLFIREAEYIFDHFPQVKSFGWSQYTPYFNDGEECVFGAYTDEPYINGYDRYGDYDDGTNDLPNIWKNSDKTTGEYVNNPEYDLDGPRSYRNPARIWKELPNPNYDPRNGEAVEAVVTFLRQFDDEHLKRMFGDHTFVTVTPEGIETEEYEHD